MARKTAGRIVSTKKKGKVPKTLSDNLRTAMSIELATLPPYLYAFWSVKTREEGGSVAGEWAAKTILSVITEEMLHFSLVGNVMKALGISTRINDPDYIPKYPGTLPGHSTTVNPFTVSLQPLNQSAIQTFLDIELPAYDDPPVIPPRTKGWTTLGEFYAAIENELTADLDYSHGGQMSFDNNPAPGVLIQVKDQKSAKQALEEIVDQGEGKAKPKNPQNDDYEWDKDHELSHYYKFEKINTALNNKTLDPAKDVYPVITNPDASKYNDEQKAANLRFNRIYSQLLDALQKTYKTSDPTVWYSATSLMVEMKQAAAFLRNRGPVPGTKFLPGPTFEYVK